VAGLTSKGDLERVSLDTRFSTLVVVKIVWGSERSLNGRKKESGKRGDSNGGGKEKH